MTLANLIDQIDIIEFLSTYIKLTKKGNQYWGICPFHGEKTPSFSVSRTKKVYYCFGCGEKGNIISFLKNKEHYSHTEIIEYLQQRYQVKIQTKKGKNALVENQSLSSALGQWTQFFQQQLMKNKGELDYVHQRGIEDLVIKDFALGYAPEAYLQKQQSTENLEIVQQMGLWDKGKFFFENKLIFPISDKRGHTIAFGARNNSEFGPKYINSKNTKFFQKKNSFYGLWESLKAIEEQQAAIICEGYFDVLSFHQMGYKNAIAPLGTAVSWEHLNLLKPYCQTIISCFDNDLAGFQAFVRLFEKIIHLPHFQLRVLTLTEHKDVNDYLRQNKIESIHKQMNHLVEPLKFYLDQLKQWNIAQSIPQILGKVFPMVTTVETYSQVQADQMLQMLAQYLNIDFVALKTDLQKFQNQSVSPKTFQKSQNKGELLESDLVCALLVQPECFDFIRIHIQQQHLQQGWVKKFYQEFEFLYLKGNNPFTAIENLPFVQKQIILYRIKEHEFDQIDRYYIQSLVVKIFERFLQAKQKQWQKQLKDKEQQANYSVVEGLMKDLVFIQKVKQQTLFLI